MPLSMCLTASCEQVMRQDMPYISETVFPRLARRIPEMRKLKRFREIMDQFIWVICPELRQEMAHFYRTGERPLRKYRKNQLRELESLLLERTTFLAK